MVESATSGGDARLRPSVPVNARALRHSECYDDIINLATLIRSMIEARLYLS
jgi:hypothetical protein